MEQPWQQPQEPAPDAGDLPLAGLLAELLAASETESAPPPADDPVAALARPAGWPGSEPEASLEAPQVLRALEEAAPPMPSPDSGELSGILLARLIGDGGPEAGAEAPSGASDERPPAASAAGATAEVECAAPVQDGAETPAAAEAVSAQPEATGGDLSAALLDRLMSEGQPGAAGDAAEVSADEREVVAPGESASAAPPALAGDEPGIEPEPLLAEEAGAPATESPSLVQDGSEQAEQEPAGQLAAEATAPEAPEPVAAVSQSDAGFTAPTGDDAGQDGAAAAGTPPIPELGGMEPPRESSAWSGELGAAHGEDGAAARLEPAGVPAPAGTAEDATDLPSARPSVIPAGDEDEFELVDAAQAEKMLDRLLDAARSAIRSTQPPPPGGALPVSAPAAAPLPPAQAVEAEASQPWAKPEPVGSRAPASAVSAEAGEAAVVAPPAPPGEPEISEAPPRRAAEERAGEVSPIPPAAALMALGLPERLRARLESIGDVEQILQGQKALEPAPERKPRLLVFRAGGESYALSMECVREVERVSRVTPVPGAPEFVRGLVNLRGEILPLLDLAALFGQKGEPPAPRLIVAQASPADPVVALLVEELNGLAPFHEDGVEPPPQPGRMRGSLEHRGRRVWWIDPVAVFGAEALEKAAGGGQLAGMEESA